MMKILKREIQKELKILLKEYPVVVILGPRQAGKTTLAKTLKKYQYYSLETPETRHLAENDPKAFLNSLKQYVILDEIQRVPSMFSYIQTIVDENNKSGQFVLTGSHQLQITEIITQSLAGRAGILNLLPFSIQEMKSSGIQYKHFQHYVHTGFLPRIHSQKQRPLKAYSNYYRTYIERDVRQIVQIKEYSFFERFIKLFSGRVGQFLNCHSLARDVGVSAKTIKNWISVLEASFIVYKLSPYFENFGKRYIRSPKYYFTETGLLSYLLDIQKPSQVIRDPLVGNIFENLVVIDCLKSQLNKGIDPQFYFFRDSNHNEIDLLFKKNQTLHAIEIKTVSTYHPRMSEKLKKMKNFHKKIKTAHIIYNGETRKLSGNTGLIHFKDAGPFIAKLK